MNRLTFHKSLIPLQIRVGVDLIVPATVEIEEGSTGQICVEIISNRSVARLRDVELSIMIGYLSGE